MTDHDIQTSQHLLKKLIKETTSMRELMRQVQVMAYNMNGTWTAISVTQSNWNRKIKEGSQKKPEEEA